MKYCVTLYGVSHRHSEDNVYCDSLDDIPAAIAGFLADMDHIEIEGFNEDGYDFEDLEYSIGGFSVRETKDVEFDEEAILHKLGGLLVEKAKKDLARWEESKRLREIEELARLKRKYT